MPPLGIIRPPGARYDPIDPFEGPINDRNNPDFAGFDQWGQPKGGRGRNNGGFGGFGNFGGGNFDRFI